MYPVASRQTTPRDPSFWTVFNGAKPSQVQEMIIRAELKEKVRKIPKTWLEHVVSHDILWNQRGDILRTVENLTGRLQTTQAKIQALKNTISSQGLIEDPMFLMDDSPQAFLAEEEAVKESLEKSKSGFETQLQKVETERRLYVEMIQKIQEEQLGRDRKALSLEFIENPAKRYEGLPRMSDVFALRSQIEEKYPRVTVNSREHRPLLSPRGDAPLDPEFQEFLENSRVINLTPSLDPEVLTVLCRKGSSELASNQSFPCGPTPSPLWTPERRDTLKHQ